MLGLMFGNGMLQTFASQRISATVSSYMTWNGNTTEMKTKNETEKKNISKFISFRFKFFHFISIFHKFLVSIFVYVNGIKFFR